MDATVAGFDAVFGTRRGTGHDPLVDAALTRIPALTMHLLTGDGRGWVKDYCREGVRLMLREACLELEKSPCSESEGSPILIRTGDPGDARSTTVSVKEWLGRGNGYAGWKACVELARGERPDKLYIAGLADSTYSMESLDTRAIIAQVAYALVHDWEWMYEAIGSPRAFA